MDSIDSQPAAMVDATSPSPPKRWFQYRLRTLLLLVGVSAVAAFLWRTVADALPYREQRRTMALVERLGGAYQTAEASSWHRRLFGSDLQNLVVVNLADCDKADEYIGPVAGSPLLEILVVGGEAFGDEHLRRLRGTASLRHLVLDSTAVADEAIAAFRAAQPKVEVYTSERRAIASLEKLGHVGKLHGTVPPALQPHLSQEFFESCLSGCFNGKSDDANLAPVRRLRSVQRLVLPQCAVADLGLSYFAGLKELRELDISGNRITDAGLAHLTNLANLEELHLAETPITDAGVAHLKGLSRLQYLDLSSTQITDAGLVHLKGLTRLEGLELDDTRVSKAAVKDLQKALPKCDIAHHR